MADGDPIRMGLQNLQTGRTFLSRTGPNNPGDALYVTNVNTGDVVIADASHGRSLWALARNGTAVRAEAWAGGNGVEATAQFNEAIVAKAPLLGIAADSSEGVGVIGTSTAPAPFQAGDLIYQDAASFQIRVAPGIGGVTDETAGAVTASCSYRVVARRADIPGRRLEEIVLAPQGDSAPIRPSGSGAVDLPPLPPVTAPIPARAVPADPQPPPPVPTAPTLPPAMHALHREGWFADGNGTTPG